MYITGSRYIIHFYCLEVEAGFYIGMAECSPVNPVTQVRFPAGTGWNLFTSSYTVRVVIFSRCMLPCLKTVMPDKTDKMSQIPG